MQVGMATNNPWLSAVFSHPLPTLMVGEPCDDVNVGPGSLFMVPVGV